MEHIASILTEIGIPFAYDHFAEGEAPDPPFICYLTPESDNFSADGSVYLKVAVLHIELYTDEKAPAIPINGSAASGNAITNLRTAKNVAPRIYMKTT